MRDPLRERLDQVPVPPEGRERVLAQLTREWQTISAMADHEGVAGSESAASVSRSMGRTVRRTRLWLSATGLSAALLIALGLWWSAAPRLDAREIEFAAIAAPSHLADSDTGVPYTWEWPRSFNASLLRSARRVVINVHGREVVLLSFDLRRGRARPVPGWFVVVPARWLKTAPGVGEFLGGEFSYSARHTATWWVEGNFAYACVLGTGDTRLFEACLPQRWST